MKSYGAPSSSTFLLDPNNPKSINYLDLIDDTKKSYIDGVIEHDGRSVVYFLDASNLATDPKERKNIISRARGILACRAEAAVLAIIEPGQLILYPCNRFIPNDTGNVIMANTKAADNLIQDIIEGYLPTPLSNYLYGTSRTKESSVHDLLFQLLKQVGHELNSTNTLHGKHEVILALVGRALLARFLLDRKIITSKTFPAIFKLDSPENFFSSPEKAALVNKWMDDTFNGEFLPLPQDRDKYEKWFKTLDRDVFLKLSYILSHSDSSGQMSLPSFVDFAHVPVGLLSEVYERYAHENLDKEIKEKARKESIHYTPRNIADYMLDQSFSAIKTVKKDKTKILDPSCGAGVFIILGFKRLIQERWKATKKRPDTKTIRDIMYSQITGFDVNKAALNLTALGLYLSALELDPEPLPPSKLKFKQNLIGSVLHLTRDKDEPWPEYPVVMGSLKKDRTNRFSGKYDLVIGNPPWSNFPASMKGKLTDVVKSVAINRDANYLSNVVEKHENPDQVPDLPFVWKSMDWAKPKAIIAFALHARFLFKTSSKGATSREHLFKALNVTGILNASAMRQTKVWPGVDAQFCLLFANNSIPTENNYFNFISPDHDKVLNDKMGRMRIDYLNANPVQAQALIEKPYLLKSLYKGTPLDVDVIDRIVSLSSEHHAVPLKAYWDMDVGEKRNGQGYKRATKLKPANELLAMKPLNLTKHDDAGYIIDPKNLSDFKHLLLEAQRATTIYETPLVVVNKAIGAKKDTISVRIARSGRPIAYNESFYGYSACGHPESELLAEYLFVLLSSNLFLYYTLMVSPEYAVEREAIQKGEIDQFPIFPLSTLTQTQKNNIRKIAKSFKTSPDWTALNYFVNKLYGINNYDKKVIDDSLTVGLPIAASRKRASALPKPNEIDSFTKTLLECIKPLDATIIFEKKMPKSWVAFSISGEGVNHSTSFKIYNELYSLTHNMGTTRIIHAEQGIIHIAMLAQYRYWTPSRARLLAIELLRDYSGVLG